MKLFWCKIAVIFTIAFNIAGLYAAAAYAGEAGTGSAKVLATSLTVRSQPDGESPAIGSLKNNAIVSTFGESFGWIQVAYGRTTGWVAGYYLQMLDVDTPDKQGKAVPAQTPSKPSSRAEVLADLLHMRKGPGMDNPAVRILELGNALQILDRQNDWLQAKTADGDTGWVLAKYVGEPQSQSNGQGQVKALSTTDKGKGKGINGKVIVIDPGHGGNDSGVIGKKYGTYEKSLNLSTARYVADKLREAGAQAVLTREKDENEELSARVKISESKKADAFVSVHYNSSPKPVSGTLTFYYSKSKDESLARKLEAELNQALELKSNGISFGDYHVLRENGRPSALVELGFLSNPKDEAIARTSAYQQKAAEAIVNGLKAYFND
ncbi:N-acetylmuramoyl-L-alanine amidase [Paenibacillus piri]|uniref:N-acetylmuramoyl-L-alanine amidase n=1 Tax=Paenibacillus piri TaxID=2547395 RepID=UPI001405314B|nr:N-acetylmuramoyl-L-alanine amidase [Paenibacillus piri]